MTHSVESAADASYNGGSGLLAPGEEVAVTVLDDDSPGVLFSVSTITVAEGGSGAVYSVQLLSRPEHAVSVTPSLGGASPEAATLSASELVFPADETWADVQSVTVSPVDNEEVDSGGRTLEIAHSVSSVDAKCVERRLPRPRTPALTRCRGDSYDSQAAQLLPDGGVVDVTVIGECPHAWSQAAATEGLTRVGAADVSQPYVVASRSSLQVAEGGADGASSSSYTLVLSTSGTVDIDLSLSGAGAAFLTIDPPSTRVSFTTDNWDMPVTVTLTAVNNDAFDGDQTFTVSHSALWDGEAVNFLPSGDVEVAVYDDDDAGVALLSPATVTLAEGTAEADTAVVQLVLLSEPAGDVVLSHSLGGAGASFVSRAAAVAARCVADTSTATPLMNCSPRVQVGVVPATVTFTPQDWDIPQQFTLAAIDDDVASGPQGFSLALSSASTDANYDSEASFHPAEAVSVNIVDDDAAAVRISHTAVVVAESGAAGSFSVVLQSEPAAAVDVALALSAGADQVLTLSSGESPLSFTTVNWDTPQEVNVAVIDDDIAIGPQSFTVTVSASSTDTAYNDAGAAVYVPGSVVVIDVVDDDSAGILVDSVALFVSEPGADLGGASDAFRVVLGSEPDGSASVVVDLALSGAGSSALSLTPSQLSFPAAQWNVAQEVVVDAVDDEIETGERTVSACARRCPRYDMPRTDTPWLCTVHVNTVRGERGRCVRCRAVSPVRKPAGDGCRRRPAASRDPHLCAAGADDGRSTLPCGSSGIFCRVGDRTDG